MIDPGSSLRGDLDLDLDLDLNPDPLDDAIQGG